MKKPLIILEMANNHMGDKSHSLKIMKTYSKITKKLSKKIYFVFKFQFRNLEFLLSFYQKTCFVKCL